jgi:hypothetical protein
VPGNNALYIGRSRAMSGGGLGPNLLPALASWTNNNVTQTAGQADPVGGTAAVLLTDTAVTAQHTASFVYTEPGVTGSRFFFSAYIKPGTYTNQIDIQAGSGSGGGARIIGFDPIGHGVANVGGMEGGVFVSAAANGFWFIGGYYSLSGAPSAGTALVGFGNSFPSYLGTGQTFTVHNPSLQQVF